MQNPAWKNETHPTWYKDVPEMKCLILGSFPPHEKKRHYSFYYPNSTNRFWSILAKIAKKELAYNTKNLTGKKKVTDKEKLKAVEERHDIMCLLKAGVQNMGLEIKRKGDSADDNNIIIEKFQNILSIIKKHSELEKILLPGYSAPSSTAKTFLKYLDSEGIQYDIKAKDIKSGTEFFIKAINYSWFWQPKLYQRAVSGNDLVVKLYFAVWFVMLAEKPVYEMHHRMANYHCSLPFDFPKEISL